MIEILPIYSDAFVPWQYVLTANFIDMDDNVQIQIMNNPSSSDSDSDQNERVGQLANNEDAQRRAAERRLIRENNPLANLEAITQRFGREAAESFRIIAEERKEQARSSANNRIALNWLRNYLSEEDIQSIEDKKAVHVRSIVRLFGSFGGTIVLRLNRIKNDLIGADYE